MKKTLLVMMPLLLMISVGAVLIPSGMPPVHVRYPVATRPPEQTVSQPAPEESAAPVSVPSDPPPFLPAGDSSPLAGALLHAALTTADGTVTLTDPARLAELSDLLSSTEYWGDRMAGCPFQATLTLVYADGIERTAQLATDDCCVFRYQGHDYMYARSRKVPPDYSVRNTLVFDLFR